MAKLEPAHKNEPKIPLKIDDLVTKTMFGDRKKLSLIERGFFFLEIDKTCPKWFVQFNFFDFFPHLWLQWSLPTINEHNLTEIDVLVTKTIFGHRKS